MGTVVGLFNIAAKDIVTLSVAATAIIVVGTTGFEPLDQLANGLGSHTNEIVRCLARLMAPAAVISAVRVFANVGFPKY